MYHWSNSLGVILPYLNNNGKPFSYFLQCDWAGKEICAEYDEIKKPPFPKEVAGEA